MAEVQNGTQQISVVKSPADTREYRAIVLQNRFRAVLISEPKADKAAACISVGAGCLCDPKEIPGIAHLCEHMLFLGTGKYPEENDFEKFLSDNGGGSSNAWTDEDNTTYYFDVAPEYLVGALDRFSQFFIDPLFTESGTEREINAVNSEHEKNIPDDNWRMAEIHKKTANPAHPFNNFGTGNRDTLWVRPKEKSIDIRQALMEYHSKYYSANLMTLSVIGKESLDELQDIVEKLFSPIRNKDEPLPIWTENPYTENELGVWINLVPEMELRDMHVVFPYGDITEMHSSASDHYITHLLGHEGEGSLLSLLKKKGWVNELSTEASVQGRGFSTFSVEFELTEDGLEHTEEIVTHLFQYLEMLKTVGIQKWVWEEFKDVEAMNFRFMDKMAPSSYVGYISPRMLKYPLENVLGAGHVITEFKPEEITKIMESLSPRNCRIILSAKENSSKVNQVEEYYGIQYSVEKVKPEVLQRWATCGLDADLKLPPRNEFIPTAFDMKPRQDWGIQPRLIFNSGISRLWFLQDNEYILPKAVAQVELYSPLPLESPLNQALNDMLKKLIEDALSEYAYAATIAGLQYKLQESIYGFEVQVGGYDHRLGVLLEKVLERIVNFSCDPKRFEIQKEVYTRKLKNWAKEQPRKHAAWYLTYLLRAKRWTHKELIESLKDVTVESLQAYAQQLVSKVKLEWFLYGNLTETEARELVTKCESLFQNKGSQGLTTEECTRLKELKLVPGSDYVFMEDHHHHSDSCTTVLFQAGMDETRENVLVELLNQMAVESCYNQLRTKEQLGYIVYSDIRKSHGTQGFQILVQSAKHPKYIESRIDCYLESLFNTIKEMTDEEFLQHRTSLITCKTEKPKRIWDRARLLWGEIITRQLKFSRVQVEVQELENVSRENVLEYFEELVGPPASKRRRLSVHIVSKTKKGAGSKKDQVDTKSQTSVLERNTVAIENVQAWKATHEFFPSLPLPDPPVVVEPVSA